MTPCGQSQFICTIRGDNNISINDLTQCRHDGRLSLEGRVWLHGADGGIDARGSADMGVLVGTLHRVVTPAATVKMLTCAVAAEDFRLDQ